MKEFTEYNVHNNKFNEYNEHTEHKNKFFEHNEYNNLSNIMIKIMTFSTRWTLHASLSDGI